jgi:hypothetical protein
VLLSNPKKVAAGSNTGSIVATKLNGSINDRRGICHKKLEIYEIDAGSTKMDTLPLFFSLRSRNDDFVMEGSRTVKLGEQIRGYNNFEPITRPTITARIIRNNHT